MAFVDSSWMLPAPFWTPPAVPETNVAVLTVILTPSGIVPLAFTGTEAQYWAPMPKAKLLDQLAMSPKLSNRDQHAFR